VATAIGIGTVTSFLVTGGFTQAIGRRGLFYIHQQEDMLTKKVSYLFSFTGLAVVAGVGLFLFLANLVYGFLPLDMVFYAELYYILLSILWMSLSILYMLKQQLLFTLITVSGMLAVHLVMLFTRWGMITAHCVGLATAIVLSYIAGWVILHRKARAAEEEYTGSKLPRMSMLVYATGPYFFYGFLYFAFLFSDRIVAWSAGRGRGLLPYFVWFESRYELGMDWALFCFILTVGVLEFTIQEFSERIIPAEQAVSADRIGSFNRRFMRFYYTHLLLFLVAACLSIAGAYWGVNYLLQMGLLPLTEVFLDPLTQSVFWWAAIGYVFLVWGLFNSVFLFALSRPAFVLRSLAPAFLLNLAIGFILSRAFHYELAVVGMTIGSVAFMFISSFYTRRTLRNLDYYYYAAY
jgi:O-antigen/teichoic acid export membrane protein